MAARSSVDHASPRAVGDGADQRPVDLRGADLRGADLSGERLSFVDLTNALLDDVDLTGTCLDHVILNGASLHGACLVRSELRFVDGIGVSVQHADAADSSWQHCCLLHLDAEHAHLARARFTNCALDRASFVSANLRQGALIACSCNDADFADANLAATETLDSTFGGARLTTARLFAGSHELIVEVLRRHVDRDDVEAHQVIGAVATMRHWCYADWKQFLTTPDMVGYYSLAQSIFEMYPRSGAARALERGAAWRQT